MKQLLGTLLILLAHSLTAQTYSFYYKETITFDMGGILKNLNLGIPKEEMDKVEADIESVPPTTYCLTVCNKRSKYEKIPAITQNKNVTETPSVTIKDFGQKSLLEVVTLGKETLGARATMSFNSWEIGKEKKTINGYDCILAESNDGNTKAWYCPLIPLAEGPYQYYGLPGLIVLVETEYYRIELYDFKLNKANTVIEDPKIDKVVKDLEALEMAMTKFNIK
jgi:GLPGLI family protein